MLAIGAYFRQVAQSTSFLIGLAVLANFSVAAWLLAGEEFIAESTVEGETASAQPLEIPDFSEDYFGTEFDLSDGTAGATTADLQERLEKDLRARRPVEFEFIARVVELVEEDDLPLGLVNRCYLWARRQSAFPFQYFQRAVQLQAKKIGVDI